jgi:hypothetical protein
MVLEKKQTTIAYRCPTCGAGIMSAVDIFALSAPMVKLKCSCGCSEMTIIKQSDGKIRIAVPCIVCPNPHSFLLSPEVFFGKEEFFLQCPYSDLNVCYIGEMDYVKANLAKGELELMELMEENGISDLSLFRQANEFDEDEALDSEQAQSVVFVLSELEAENKIFCKCEHSQTIDGEKYGYEITREGVLVKCRDCGAQRLIPTDNSLNTHAFLDADELHLE